MNALKWINTIALVAMLAINACANLIPIGGNTTGDVSKSYPNLFTPAPITFAIWGVIYLFMTAFIVFQWGGLDKNGNSTYLRESIGIWFLVSSLLNIAWLIAWHNKKIEISTVLIALLLVSLIFIVNKTAVNSSTPLSKILVKLGFDIYFGWIIVATIANISVLLTKLDWNRFGLSEVFWTVTILITGAAIAATVVITSGRWASGIAIIWAYIGILIKHIGTSGYAGKYTSIIVTGALGILVIASSIIYIALFPKRIHT